MKILEFTSNQCQCTVYKMDWIFNGENVYCIVTYHMNNGKVNTRYGNKLQMEGIINTYQCMKKQLFKLEGDN